MLKIVGKESKLAKKSGVERFLVVYMLIIGAMAVFSLIVRPGLGADSPYWHYLDIFIMASFVINSILRLFVAKHPIEFIRRNAFEYILVFLFLTQILIFGLLFSESHYRWILQALHITSITKVYIILMQGYILLALIGGLAKANTRFFNLHLPPAALFMLSFVMVIVVGAFLLMLPGSTEEGHLSLVDALFTATSATCVTGLIVKPTGSYFTTFGYSVILVLIQLGGLGLMTFATFFALIFRREFGMRHRVLLSDIMDYRVFGKIKRILTQIILITFSLEGVGAVLIYLMLPPYQEHIRKTSPIFFSVFHSVSAFCNAGFSLWDANITLFVNDLAMQGVFAGLIILGGLGFVVLIDLLHNLRKLPSELGLHHPRFTLQTRVVLFVSFFLIVIGAILIFLMDGGGNVLGRTLGWKAAAAVFQSITARTAGFNTVNIGILSLPSLLVLTVLMFIGASPGSTGGGVKTTSVAAIYALIRSRLRGERDVGLFKRIVPTQVIHNAAMIISLSLFLVIAGTLILSITDGHFGLARLLFEDVSAFGTVGLSTGITGELSVAGKLVIIITMFLGRIGPLTFLFAITGHRSRTRLSNLEERMMVG